MIRLILARHGNTFEAEQTPVQVGAKTDLPLTEHGRAQAQRLAEHLASKDLIPAAIYTGSLKRQKETAQILSDRLRVPVQFEAALTEIDYGDWEGLTSAEIAAKWPSEYAAWDKEGKWAEAIFKESFEAHRFKIQSWLNELRKKYRPDDLVIGVSSNGILRFFHPLFPQTQPPKVSTGNYCELQLFPDTLKVSSWNVST